MTALEEFIIEVSLNSEKTVKGVKEIKDSTDKLEKSLKSTDVATNKLNSGFTNLTRSLRNMALAYFSIQSIFSSFKGAIETADQLGDLSDALGISTQDLDAWGRAVHFSGGSAQEFYGTAKSMTTAIADLATKGKSRLSPFLKELGINFINSKGKAKSFIDILPELANKFSKLNEQKAFGLGTKIGLDQGTIILLRKGRIAVEELIRKQKELGTVTKEQAKIAGDFKDEWDNTAIVFRGLFTQMNSSILPIFTKLLQIFQKTIDFLKKNSKLVQGVLIGLGLAVAVFLLPPLIKAAVAAIALYAPFLLIAAAVGAAIAVFALLYDDIMHFLAGNKSLIGYLVNKYPWFAAIVRSIGVAFNWVKDQFVAFWNKLKVFPVTEFTQNIKNAFKHMGDFVIGIWDSIVEAISKAIGFVTGAIDKVVGAYNSAKDFLGLGEKQENYVIAGKNVLSDYANHPLASQTSNSIANNKTSSTKNTSVNIDNINIQTQATDSASVALDIREHFNSQMRQALNNNDDGVMI